MCFVVEVHLDCIPSSSERTLSPIEKGRTDLTVEVCVSYQAVGIHNTKGGQL